MVTCDFCGEETDAHIWDGDDLYCEQCFSGIVEDYWDDSPGDWDDAEYYAGGGYANRIYGSYR